MLTRLKSSVNPLIFLIVPFIRSDLLYILGCIGYSYVVNITRHYQESMYLEIYKNNPQQDLEGNLNIGDLPLFITGFLTAFIVALLAIKFFLKLISRIKLIPFAIYRFVLALAFWVFIL